MSKPRCFHPLILSVFPILFLYAHNMQEAVFEETIIPILLSLGITLLLWGLLRLALGNWRRSGLLVSLLLVLFYSYGHFYSLIEGTGFRIGDFLLGENKMLLPLWAAIFLLGTWAIIRKRREYLALTTILNVVSGALLVMTLFSIVTHLGGGKEMTADFHGLPEPTEAGTGEGLDIYYLILDGYASADTLRDVFSFDNREFYDYLRSRGFYLPQPSYGNYAATYLSLASSLNYEYLDPLVEKMGTDSQAKKPLLELIENNRVVAFLQAQGYKYVHVSSSGFWMTKRNRNADWNLDCGGGSEFRTILIKSTLLNLWEDMLKNEYRRRALTAFEEIPRIRESIPGPRFVFAHFLIPHPPYVFGADGEKVIQAGLHTEFHGWQYKEPYLNQLKFTNKKVRELLEKLLGDPEYRPIVVLQADHGPASIGEWHDPSPEMIRERMGIFNAYLLPLAAEGLLYPEITPVNTFRVIFNGVFKTGLSLLEDRSFFSSYDRFYDMKDVTDICRKPSPDRE